MDCIEVVKQVKPSIAFIIVKRSDGGYATGSGFVFSEKNILVTCNHVIKDSIAILLKFPDKTDHLSAKVVVRDDEHDLALLKFSDETRAPLVVGSVEEVKEGMPIIFSGYPLSIEDLTTHQGILSAITKDATGVTTYLIDGTVNSGNSGCPLMNKSGQVIGVVNAKRRENSDLLKKVEELSPGAISIHGLDIIEIHKALINNVQLGIGYAVPASYIPEHKIMQEYNVVPDEGADLVKLKK